MCESDSWCLCVCVRLPLTLVFVLLQADSQALPMKLSGCVSKWTDASMRIVPFPHTFCLLLGLWRSLGVARLLSLVLRC